MLDSSAACSTSKSHAPRALLAITTILASWLLMQIIHESGHVLGALETGGGIRRVVLVPWELSRTDLTVNPHPLVVCWGGPLFGAIAPTVLWLAARSLKLRFAFWLRFLAGFCLIANGAYIAVGALTHDGDGGDLLREGSPIWTLFLFGAITVPSGFVLWHRLGAQFGFGQEATAVRWRPAAISSLSLAMIVVAELIFAPWP